MKNEKFLLDIQTKCGDIANKILNVAIDAEKTFKCKWPNNNLFPYSLQTTKVHLEPNPTFMKKLFPQIASYYFYKNAPP